MLWSAEMILAFRPCLLKSYYMNLRTRYLRSLYLVRGLLSGSLGYKMVANHAFKFAPFDRWDAPVAAPLNATLEL